MTIINDDLNGATGVRTVTTITDTAVTVEVDGVVTETRTPTADELAMLAPIVRPPDLADVFASVPVVSLEEANDTLLALKAALEARGIV